MTIAFIIFVIISVAHFIYVDKSKVKQSEFDYYKKEYEKYYERYKEQRHAFNDAWFELYEYKEVDVIKKELEKESKNRNLLHGFINHCNDNPDQRFWQSLTNWSKYAKIYGIKTHFDRKRNSSLKFLNMLEDVFYKGEF